MIDLLKKITENISENEPMSAHTTFKIGGNADYYISPADINQLKNIITELKKQSVPYFIIGNGSNLLVSDKGIEGAVIST